MTAEELIAQARENQPGQPPPSLATLDQGLRRQPRTMLFAFDCDALVECGPGGGLPHSRSAAGQVEDLERGL